MIHQELQQVPELTVAQNIFLGASLRRGAGPSSTAPAQETESRRLLADLDPSIDVTAPIRTLRVAQRQIVEIAKALRAPCPHHRDGRADLQPHARRSLNASSR
jgi:ribose transport system ATP-binding protein